MAKLLNIPTSFEAHPHFKDVGELARDNVLFSDLIQNFPTSRKLYWRYVFVGEQLHIAQYKIKDDCNRPQGADQFPQFISAIPYRFS